MKSSLLITFLGTGTSQGVPVIGSDHPVCKSQDKKDKRLRSSVLISWGDTNVVIDCGPDFRQQMLRENVSNLEAILFTHEHSDHTAGIDDVRPIYFKQGYINFYAHKRVFESLYKRFDYIFKTADKYPGTPTVTEFVIDDENPFIINGKTIIPIEGMHGTLPVLGYRIDDFTYFTDINSISETAFKKVVGTKILVVNALYHKEHHAHFNLKQAIEFVKKVNPEKAYFTHISHLLGFHKEVEKQLPKNMFLAYDTLKLKI
jgi:phosphoribosyl 1,2-cyclic phosphate phosphodiesterase